MEGNYRESSPFFGHFWHRLKKMLKLSDLVRLEFHGPAAELDKLRERCAPLNPAWFVSQCGISR